MISITELPNEQKIHMGKSGELNLIESVGAINNIWFRLAYV